MNNKCLFFHYPYSKSSIILFSSQEKIILFQTGNVDDHSKEIFCCRYLVIPEKPGPLLYFITLLQTYSLFLLFLFSLRNWRYILFCR